MASSGGAAGAPLGGTFSRGGGALLGGGGGGPVTGGAPPVELSNFPNYALTGSWPNRPVALATKPGQLVFTKIAVHDRFLAESCAIGDYDGDGNPDVSAGRRWYRGPFTEANGGLRPIEELVFRGGHDDLPRAGLGAELVTGVSDDQSDFAFDLDGDGDVDIVNIASPDTNDDQNPSPAPAPQPTASAYWYENPGPELAASTTSWQRHLIHDDVRHEQHGIGDVDGDGWPEIYGACKTCDPAMTFGYYQRNPHDPKAKWSYHAVTTRKEFPFGGTGWMHGMGFGDVNGDGKPDLLERDGVWLDLLAPPGTCPGISCRYVEAELYIGGMKDYQHTGGSHMFATDVDGDGDNDVISAENAHSYGVAWWENVGDNTLQFVKHRFVGSPNDFGPDIAVIFSQPHALEVADLDGDGIPEVITGKTRLANPDGCGDPDLQGDPVSFAFKISRTPTETSPVTFTAIPIDTSNSKVGVGRQIAVGHLNTDGIVDLCLATKLGLHVFLGQ